MKHFIPEHPFAEFIRILGKGKRGSRSLTQDEAYRAMRMILNDQIEPVQLGAFLMLMRIKEETAEELVGFVRAARESFQLPYEVEIDLDCSSYAGKRRHLPWFLLSLLLLAENGVKILIHGAGGHGGRIYTHQALPILGYQAANSVIQAIQQIEQVNFSYLSLEHFCPKLYEMINLRPLIGLRSPVHTLVRLLNPLQAPYSIQGIFHPGYRQVHQEAALLLNQPNMAVLKGEGGETERNPDMDCLVQSVTDRQLTQELWPALFSRRHTKPDQLDLQQLVKLWQGKITDEFAEATIIGTAAITLKLLGRATSQQAAYELAQNYWLNRKSTKENS